MTHPGDYTREEKIAMTAAALGIEVPKGRPKPFTEGLFFPRENTSVIEQPRPVVEESMEAKIARRYDGSPSWEVVRKKAAKNLSHILYCSYCGESGTDRHGPDGLFWHIDHIHPRDKGGSDEMDNLCKACHACNVHKHTKIIRPRSGTLRADGSVEP
jgi:5-methylcytosine-specific restriction endonuclease McrA